MAKTILTFVADALDRPIRSGVQLTWRDVNWKAADLYTGDSVFYVAARNPYRWALYMYTDPDGLYAVAYSFDGPQGFSGYELRRVSPSVGQEPGTKEYPHRCRCGAPAFHAIFSTDCSANCKSPGE